MKRIIVAAAAAVLILSSALVAFGGTGSSNGVYVLQSSNNGLAPAEIALKRCPDDVMGYAGDITVKFVRFIPETGRVVLRCV